MNTDDLTNALRNCAAGLLPLEADTELLISNGTFLHRADFTALHWTTAGFRQIISNQACISRPRTASRP
jgi:hypothetical protein